MAAGGAFQRQNNIQNRYSLLLRPGFTDGDSDEEDQPGKSQEYAAFLREKDRKVGPDGFLDSSRLRHSQSSRKEKKEQTDDKPTYTTVIELTSRKERDKKDYDRRIKVIEDHMWQHKQEERELKRVEGDIIKDQRALRKTLRDYENAITRKRLAEEKKLNQSLDKYAGLQRQHQHKKEQLTKQRLEKTQNTDQQHKDQGRKVQITTSDLARNYRSKYGELEIKRMEVDRFAKDYEEKMRKKEEEQYKLKQELAEIAIALNMEAQKGRVQETNFQKDQRKNTDKQVEDDRDAQQNLDKQVGRSDGDLKASEGNKRRLSADLALTRAHLQLKQREEVRHLKDTRSQLQGNRSDQKHLNDAATHAEMDQQSRQIDHKIQAHNARRRAHAHAIQHEKKERSETSESHFSSKAQKRFSEQQRRDHEDHLKHFQKAVTRGEDLEHQLYNQVKNTEYARQKKSSAVRQLHSKLLEAKREHAARIKTEMLELQKQEEEIQQRLLKEKAELDKAHSQREESYQSLQKHREQLRHDRYLYEEHQREHNRLLRVGARTDAQQSDSY